jgi:hypothetical protein
MADYTAYELGNILRRLEKKVDAALCCCESLELKNLGLGVPIYVGRFKNHLKIRSLVAGTNMNITYDNNTITFDSLAGGFTCSDLNSCSTSNLPEGSNLYYTNARVLSYMTGQNISIFTNDSGYITSAALAPYLTIASAAATYYPLTNPSSYIPLTALSGGTGISYNNLTGVITNSAPNQVVSLTQGGTTTITGTYPNFTISSADSTLGTVTSVATGTGLTGGTITASGTVELNTKLAPLDTLTGNSLKVPRVNVGETAVEYFTPTYGTGSVTSVGTTGLISGGPITTTGTITTSMNTNKLVGRSTAGTGVMEEISLGTRLSLSGSTLNVGMSTVLNSMTVGTIAASTTTYILPESNIASVTESARTYYLNNACTAARYLVATSTAQSATGSLVVTFRNSAASTSITVTIAAGSAAGRVTDYVNTASCLVDSGISHQVVNNATATSANIAQISINLNG